MLFHFSCPYEKAYKQSAENIRTQNLKSDKTSNYVREGGKTLPK